MTIRGMVPDRSVCKAMRKTQLFLLFVCSLSCWTVAQGTLGLLPVYAVRLGAEPTLIGNYLSLTYLALTVGTIGAGWLSDKFQRRKVMLLLAGLGNIAALWLMGQARVFWQIAALTAFVWFLIGVVLTTINILAGLFAGEAERGKIFGILAINISLGALIGGFTGGLIVDHGGYPTLFLVAALCWTVQPLMTLFVRDRVLERAQNEAVKPSPTRPTLGGAFYLLLLAIVIAFVAVFVAVMGRPLLMDELRFGPADISRVGAIGGAFSLPFPLLLGWLSDHVGRYRLLILCFWVGAAGLIVLAASVSLWHFWLSSILMASPGVSLGISPALVADLVPQESLGMALARLGAAPWTGGIIGFAIAGYAIQDLGMTASLIGAALLTLIAIALLIRVQRIAHSSLPYSSSRSRIVHNCSNKAADA